MAELCLSCLQKTQPTHHENQWNYTRPQQVTETSWSSSAPFPENGPTSPVTLRKAASSFQSGVGKTELCHLKDEELPQLNGGSWRGIKHPGSGQRAATKEKLKDQVVLFIAATAAAAARWKYSLWIPVLFLIYHTFWFHPRLWGFSVVRHRRSQVPAGLSLGIWLLTLLLLSTRFDS